MRRSVFAIAIVVAFLRAPVDVTGQQVNRGPILPGHILLLCRGQSDLSFYSNGKTVPVGYYETFIDIDLNARTISEQLWGSSVRTTSPADIAQNLIQSMIPSQNQIILGSNQKILGHIYIDRTSGFFDEVLFIRYGAVHVVGGCQKTRGQKETPSNPKF